MAEYLENEVVEVDPIGPDDPVVDDSETADARSEYLNLHGLMRLLPYLVPPGIIMAYSPTTIPPVAPTGWVICDGQNGTPDLRGRFILGAKEEDASDVSTTGGSETHTLTINELPAHTHSFTGVNLTEDGLGGSLFSGGEDTISPSGSSTTGSTGGGEAFSTMPPYYTLVYIMKLEYGDPFQAEDEEVSGGGSEEEAVPVT